MRASMIAFAGVAVCAVALPAGSQEPLNRTGYFNPASLSEELARQPQTPGAIGDQQRHYYFEEAESEMPYRLYVPETYDPETPTPLVVALHGYSGDQDTFFKVVEDLPNKLEEHGFIFVAPMGYNSGSWYGAGGPAARDDDTSTANVIPHNGLSVTELGEMDVLNVIDIVRGEYNIDPDRTFLMGHSMGGAGTWYVGQKYPDMWAAIAPMSGTGGNFVMHDFEALLEVPMMIAVGELEDNQIEENRAAVETMNAAGGEAVYLEIEGGDHGSMVPPSTPQVLDFFAAVAQRE